MQRYRKFVISLHFADNRIAEGAIFTSLLFSKKSAVPFIKLFSGPLKTCCMNVDMITYVFRKEQYLKYYWVPLAQTEIPFQG